MPARIDITWVSDRPEWIDDPEQVRYLSERVTKIGGKRVVEQVTTEFTVCSTRPATAEDVAAWKGQP